MSINCEVFLFDYSVSEKENKIRLYGYMEGIRKKLEIEIENFKIELHLRVDRSSLKNKQMSMEEILREVRIPNIARNKKATANSNIWGIVQTIQRCDMIPFKGYCDESEMYQVGFSEFGHYEVFKNVLSQLNEEMLQSEEEKNEETVLRQEQFGKLLENKKTIVFRMSEDDRASSYVLKLQRHYGIQLSAWNTIKLDSKWATQMDSPFGQEKNSMKYRIQVSCDISNIEYREQANKPDAMPLTILCWDLEVRMKNGVFSKDGNTLDNQLICIGCSFMQMDKKNPFLLNIAFTESESRYHLYSKQLLQMNRHNMKHHVLDCMRLIEEEQRSDQQDKQNRIVEEISHLQIVVESECEMIQCFCYIIQLLDPSFITGFNDSQFDVPFLQGKIELYKEVYKKKFSILDIEVTNALFGRSEVKINAQDKKLGTSILLPGIIAVDTRVLLMKTQKLEKKSLNDYLEANKLPKKMEVSFKEMNDAFDNVVLKKQKNEHHTKTLNLVYKYCMYDSDACRLLWEKRNIVIQAMEVAKLAFTPLRCSLLNADGMKVRNMVARFAFQRNYSVPMTSTSNDIRINDMQVLEEYEKYPGAYVPEPHKGISITPVSALDFASLYPSIIMAHNLSPEMIVSDKQLYKGNQELLFEVNVPFEKQIPKASNPTEKETKSTVIQGYVIKRDQKVGVYPTILKYLFDLRKSVRSDISAIENGLDKCTEQEKQEQLFLITLLNCKQIAIKVFMNTFYGECGNQLSSLFDVVIAGGTTTMGQKYIKMVHKYLEEHDCEVVYGDTDSVYFRPRFSHYQQFLVDQDGSDTLDNMIVKQSIIITEQFKHAVNKEIGALTYGFLKMEFEEMLLPSCFMGKKKYAGVIYKPDPLLSQPIVTDVQIKQVLLKGIDFIKSQYPPIIKEYGYTTITDILSYYARKFKSFCSQSCAIADLFDDSLRSILNQELPQIVQSKYCSLIQQINNSTYLDTMQFAVKKKLRANKNGEMALFKRRLELGCNSSPYQAVTSDIDLFSITINAKELEALNISIPEEGEILDLVYINNYQKKSSARLHLASYAQARQLQFDTNSYLDMYKTTGSRILVCLYTDSLTQDSEGVSSIISSERALRLSRALFTQPDQQIEPVISINTSLPVSLSEYKRVYDLIHDQMGPMLTTKFAAIPTTYANTTEFKKTLLQYIDVDPVLFILLQIIVNPLNIMRLKYIDKKLFSKVFDISFDRFGRFVACLLIWFKFDPIHKNIATSVKLQHIANFCSQGFITLRR